MAFFYMDTDAGSDASAGTSWATAKLTFEGLLAVMSAGDVAFVQGTTDDTAASARTFTSPGTLSNPCVIINVKDGTTNEGTSVATTDMVVRGTDTLTPISTTGGNMSFAGAAQVHGCDFSSSAWIQYAAAGNVWEYHQSKYSYSVLVNINGGKLTLVNCEIETLGTSAQFATRNTNSPPYDLEIYGGVFTFTANPTVLFHPTLSYSGALMQGVDLSGLDSATELHGAAQQGLLTYRNCEFPATYTRFVSTPTSNHVRLEMIGCSDDSSVSNTSSIPDYVSEDLYGTVEAEFTKVRTGGATDGAAGAFSYKMTATANGVLESSNANLASPWLSVWVDGGSSITLTVYIANDGAGDLNEDEVWTEFYTPDAGDTAAFDQNFDPALARLISSSTAVTDDTTSTWGGSLGNAQKMSATITPGYEGYAYARVHVAKRQATPDPVYIDPEIEVT